jgi:crotonobetainyl-CoA:carnitine CoA-transferase CaiB-like acyl-CoA transferase
MGCWPVLGEHTDEVLRGLGVDDAELARLAAANVIGTIPVAR